MKPHAERLQPRRSGAHAYDATTLLLHAIEAVAVAEDGKLLVDRAALRQQLSATTGFKGLIGTLSCDDFGDLRRRAHQHLPSRRLRRYRTSPQLPVVPSVRAVSLATINQGICLTL